MEQMPDGWGSRASVVSLSATSFTHTTLDVGRLVHMDFPGWEFVLGITREGAVHHFEMICTEHERPQHWRLGGVAVEAPWPDLAPHAGAGLSSRRLGAVPLIDLRDELARVVRSAAAPTTDRPNGLPQLALSTRLIGPGPRRRRSDLDHAVFAAKYADLVARDHPAPIKALAEELGKTTAVVRNLRDRACNDGLLTKPPAPGRAGGELTEKARALLADRE